MVRSVDVQNNKKEKKYETTTYTTTRGFLYQVTLIQKK